MEKSLSKPLKCTTSLRIWYPHIKSGEFSQAEVNTAVKQMKSGKAPGLDGLLPEFWKLSKVKKHLRKFCNATFKGNRPKEWGLSSITPLPKKGDLTVTDNYRGSSLTQSASKVYNRCLLNRIRPVIDRVLRPNQNGFWKENLPPLTCSLSVA